MAKSVRSNPAAWGALFVAVVILFFTTLQPRFGSQPAWGVGAFGNEWAGTATGSANNYIVSVPNMDSYHAGYTLRFNANLPNTGPATMQVQNLTGTLAQQNIYKIGPTGPVALSGGEIQPGATAVFYDGAEFVLLTQQSPIIPGFVMDWTGPIAPAGWLVAGGQSVSRSTYAALFNNTTIQMNGTLNGTTTVTGLSTTAGLVPGYWACGTDILNSTQISTVDSGSQIHINQAATGSGTFSLVFAPNGCGDGTTTFGIIDLRARAAVGKDDMSGSASGRLTVGGSGCNGVQVGLGCGSQSIDLTASNLPQQSFTPAGTIAINSFTPSGTIGGSQATPNIICISCGATLTGGGGSPNLSNETITINGSSFSFAGNSVTPTGSFTGSPISIGNAVPIQVVTLPPAGVVYKVVKY